MAETLGQKLQAETTGLRLTISKLGCRRTMDRNQLERVANLFDADQRSLSGSRAIINRKHPAVAPIHRLLGEVRDYIHDRSVDYPEQGVRLCKLSNVDRIAAYIEERRAELDGLLAELDADWASVKAEAKTRLANLYCEADYLDKPSMAFGLYISFPAIKPDERLLQINPELYAAEQSRIAAKFADALQAAEAAAAEQLKELLQHFVDRLTPGEDGEKKTLRGSTLENIKEFTELFAETSIGTNAELEAIVAQIDALASGLDAKAIRKSGPEEKGKLVADVSNVLSNLDSLIATMPSRAIELD
jgi:uncharacterized protein YciW